MARPSVAIIGAGPAGLLAAHGATIEGGRVTIYDVRPEYRPGTIFSLQYLHEPCHLELVVRSMKLHYQTTGSEKWDRPWSGAVQAEARGKYNRKLGRPEFEENSTRFLFNSPVQVWSLKDAYRTLWHMYKASTKQKAIDWDYLTQIMPTQYDVVISTAPLDRLRPDMTWPTREGLIAMHWTPYPSHPEDTCVYNLNPDVPWYRATCLDGDCATEFVLGSETKSGVPKSLKRLRKVAAHTNVFGPMPSNLWLTGRWGSWDPAKLTHHAFRDGREAVRIATGSVRTTV